MIRSMGIPASDGSLALSDAVSAAELTPPSRAAARPAAAHAALIDFIVYSIYSFRSGSFTKLLRIAWTCGASAGITE